MKHLAIAALLVLAGCGTQRTLATADPPTTTFPPASTSGCPTEETGTTPCPPETTTTTLEVAAATETAVRITTTSEAPTVTLPPTPGCRPACHLEGDVPVYPNRDGCTEADAQIIRDAFAARGLSWDDQQFAVFVASRESSCDYTALYINPATNDRSSCAFQLNAAKGGPLSPAGHLGQLGYTPESVRSSMEECAKAAAELMTLCGHNPWLRKACRAGSTGWYI